jgi:hypothetical protein
MGQQKRTKFRFTLRALLVALALGPPLLAGALWLWRSGQLAGLLRPSVAERRAEVEFAKCLDDGTNRTKAGVRHAELRYRREDAIARKESALYRALVPEIP